VLLPGEDPGIQVRGRETLSEARGLAAPRGSSVKPWLGPRDDSPQKLLSFRDFLSITCFPSVHFYYISVILNGVNFIK
jgi:hypothetical protein